MSSVFGVDGGFAAWLVALFGFSHLDSSHVSVGPRAQPDPVQLTLHKLTLPAHKASTHYQWTSPKLYRPLLSPCPVTQRNQIKTLPPRHAHAPCSPSSLHRKSFRNVARLSSAQKSLSKGNTNSSSSRTLTKSPSQAASKFLAVTSAISGSEEVSSRWGGRRRRLIASAISCPYSVLP